MPMNGINFGAVAGLGEGLSNFANQYQNQQKMGFLQQQIDLQNRQQAGSELTHDQAYDPQTGQLTRTDVGQAKEALIKQKTDQETDYIDPNSPNLQPAIEASKMMLKNNMSGLLGNFPTAHPDGSPLTSDEQDQIEQQKDTVAQGLLGGIVNRAQLDSRMGMLQDAYKTAAQMKLAQSKQAFTQQNSTGLLNVRQGNLALAKNKAIASAQQDISKDPQVDQTQGDYLRSQQDLNVLTSGQKITPQMVEDLTAGYAQLMSGKGAATDTLRQSIGLNTVSQKIPSMIQDITGKTLDALSPDQKEFLTDAFQRLAYAKKAQAGYYAITKRNEYPDPEIQSYHDKVINNFAPGWSPGQKAQDWMINYMKNAPVPAGNNAQPIPPLNDVIQEMQRRGMQVK